MSGIGESPNTPAAPGASDQSALTDTGLEEMFTGQPGTGTDTGVEGGAPPQPSPDAGQQTPPVDPAASAAPPVPPAPSPETLALREVIETLKRTSQPKAGSDAAQPQAPDPLRDVPAYQFNLPPQVLNGLAHEDPAVRGQTLSAVISAVGRTIHQQVLNQVHANLDALRQTIPEAVYGTVSETEMQRTVNTDFYGKYPQYNTPMMRPLVQMALVQVAKANPALAANGWTPELRDAVGAYLQQQVPIAAKAPAAAPAGPKAPPVLMGQGSRPAAPVVDGNQQALDEFFG